MAQISRMTFLHAGFCGDEKPECPNSHVAIVLVSPRNHKRVEQISKIQPEMLDVVHRMRFQFIRLIRVIRGS